MEQSKDISGQALNYGLQGGIYLFNLKDYQMAYEVYKTDYKLLDQHGSETERSGVANKVSMAILFRLQTKPDFPNEEEMIDEALEYNRESIELANRLGQFWNLPFSYSHLRSILEYQIQREIDRSISPSKIDLSLVQQMVCN